MDGADAEKKHLVPLLEFLRFVAERGKNQRTRFPKRINGVTGLKREASETGFDGDSPSLPLDYRYEDLYSSGDEKSPSAAEGSHLGASPTQERHKRSRSDDNVTEARVASEEPINCELGSTMTGKGCVTSKYFDFSLLDLGVEPIITPSSQPLSKEVVKHLQGMPCCYVLPGTSMVVTGDIVDVSLTSGTVLVSPDRGIRVGLEWVSIRRVFQVPKNISAVREQAALRIQRIIDAARRGERTPPISPVRLAENTDSLSTTPSPISDDNF
ncbi:hypothetical protein NESM_000452200 [Novymonas esmeraldas]|uniref:RecQ mediated genome instability protein 1 N-terminal domain-containing protein n=1 Tax=Novymonas esmeraldas TaxID=1808958 RepID=A0AAW0EMB3_9TRYP